MNAGLNTDDIRESVARELDIPLESIGVDDDLISLGLDSIRMMKIAGGWRKQGYTINFAQLAADPNVGSWFDLLRATAPQEHQPSEQPTPTSDDEPFPLAQMQHAFWIGRSEDQALGGVAAHLYVEFDGTDVDPAQLARAVERLVEIHPMLRAQFLPDGTQRILPRLVHPPFAVIDLRTTGDVDTRLQAIRDEKSHQRLRVEDGEVVDITLTLLPDGRTRLHLDLDMLAADAMSYRTLIADLADLYHGATLAPASYSYRRYLAERTPGNREADREWWQQRLDDLPAAPTLPVVPEAERENPHRTVRYHHWLTPEAKERLLAGAHARGVTPAMALASVFAETIGFWSTEQRFLLNLPLFYREPLHAEIDRVVGDFTSSVMLEVDVSEPASVVERAHALQNTLHANGAHAAYSGLDVLRDLGRHRGEQVLAPVVYTSALNLGELFADSVRETFGEAAYIVSQGPQVLLDAQVTEVRGGLLLNWDVRECAFQPGVIDAMFAQYTAAVDRLAQGDASWTAEAAPRLPLDQLTVRHRVNDTAGAVSGRVLHEGFFDTAATTPGATALLWDGGVLTYAELAERALRVAGALQAQGVTTGDRVAVQLPKGPEQIVAILGVLAAGAAYVPIAFDQPTARRAQILDTAEPAAALSVSPDKFADTGVTALAVASAAAYDEPLPAPVLPDPETIAYIIFTSGSTGTPKGVDVPHRAAMNTIDACNDHFAVTAADRALVISALEFDASVYDVFGMLAAGGSLVAMSDAQRENTFQWVDLLNRYQVTILNCVPSMLDMLLTAGGLGTSLRAVLLGGDWVGADLPARLHAVVPDCRFAGLGGATETAIHFSVCEVSAAPAHWKAVPFGTPLKNVQCRVTNPAGSDCPDWVAGELWVGGAGVAHGYRKDPERTAARFVTYEAQNWYRTGDLARYQPDGTLEFLGRADNQVKIRGYRIELGEIEGALRRLDAVQQAVAVVVGTSAPKLAAAVTVTGPTTAEDLQAALAELLPRYMVPGRLEILDEFPLTSNGKLDRRAIQRLLDAGDEHSEYVAPRTALETALTAIIGEVLGVERVGATDDFFALGGDSVLATTLIARIRNWLDAPHAVVADIFAGRKIEGLARRLTTNDTAPDRLEQVAEVYLEVAALDDEELAHLT